MTLQEEVVKINILLEHNLRFSFNYNCNIIKNIRI
jgi:hypothetical protein